MIKLPFAVLASAVDALYAQSISSDDLKAIEEQSILIEGLIQGAGWEINEFFERWLRCEDVGAFTCHLTSRPRRLRLKG